VSDGIARPRIPVPSLVGAAIVVGVGIAWLDSRPGWDDTGITVGMLSVAALGATLLAGGRRPWLWAVLVGGWTPLLEIPSTGQFASLAALVFAALGALTGAVLARSGRDPLGG
jgi:hypothetical protein